MQKSVNTWDEAQQQGSITPSGFWGDSIDNIVEIENFMTEEEHKRLLNFAKTNTVWDKTQTHVDKDGLVLYDANIWHERVCTQGSLRESDPEILVLVSSLIDRLKNKVSEFFDVRVRETGPAVVRWRVGDRQEPHADKEFHIGEERGRPNDFPYYDIASLFYINDDYEGGELYFPQHGLEFKPKARAAYFFPGDKFYAHGVRPVKSGMRYTCPFFWTVLEHTGEKKPPEGFVFGFHSEEYKKLFNEQ
jgi:2OG-Fe(II) oxygenase superfamily